MCEVGEYLPYKNVRLACIRERRKMKKRHRSTSLLLYDPQRALETVQAILLDARSAFQSAFSLWEVEFVGVQRTSLSLRKC
jgi:hypothetical protein